MAQRRRNENFENPEGGAMNPENGGRRRIDDFQTFEESQYDKNNPAFPEGYLEDVERQIIARLRELNVPIPRAVQEMQQIVPQVIHSQMGHHDELAQLAEDLVRDYYGSLIENVELDLEIVMPGQAGQQLDYPEDGEQDAPPDFEELNDEEIKQEIYKRRIARHVVSGAGINTHRIVHMPEVRDRLSEIDPNLYLAYDRLLKLNEILDKSIPIEEQERMWKQAPEGFAGSVDVQWPEQEEEESDEDRAQRIIDELESGKDLQDIDEAEEMLDEGKPKIVAKGIDFPMLVHEAVKGIYQLITNVPFDDFSDEQKQTVLQNVETMEQELVGHRIGPKMHKDFLDFINENPATNDHPNLMERVLGEMMLLPPENFLRIMNGILGKEAFARRQVDDVIQQIVDEQADYERQLLDYEMEQRPNVPGQEPEKDDSAPARPTPSAEKTGEVDYSQMTKSELQSILDKALEESDWETAKKISQYI